MAGKGETTHFKSVPWTIPPPLFGMGKKKNVPSGEKQSKGCEFFEVAIKMKIRGERGIETFSSPWRERSRVKRGIVGHVARPERSQKHFSIN